MAGPGRARGRFAAVSLAVLAATSACDQAQTDGPSQAVEPTTADATPQPAPSGDSSAVAARRTDLEALTDLFATDHVAPVDLGPALPDDVALASMSQATFLTTVMAATAGRPRDGHSGVFPLAQADLRLWPVQLYDFADGWRVVAALPGHEDLVGRTVTAIGGQDPATTAERVAPLVPRDNDASLAGRLPQFLVVPDVLAGVGLDPTLELDDEEVALDPVPARDYATHLDLFDPLVCPGLPREGSPWEVREQDEAVVVRWGRVVFRLDGRTSREFVDEVAATVTAADPARVVLDLRGNPGGELPAAEPLVALLREVAGARPGALQVLVGRCTFSAAALVASELRATTDARLLGEPMGGAPGLWADARVHHLPESGIAVHVASGAYGDRDLPAQSVPDVVVPVRWDDHVDGSDPALEAALRS